jgi:hypothetical protein
VPDIADDTFSAGGKVSSVGFSHATTFWAFPFPGQRNP